MKTETKFVKDGVGNHKQVGDGNPLISNDLEL